MAELVADHVGRRAFGGELVLGLAESARTRYFLRLIRGLEQVREHDAVAAALLALWLGDKAEAFVKRSGLDVHDAGINLPSVSDATPEKVGFLFRFAHRAADAGRVVANWDAILELLGWDPNEDDAPHPLLAKGGIERALEALSALTYDGTRHLEFARIAAECGVARSEFERLQDRWLAGLETLDRQSVPAPVPLEVGDLRLTQLRKDDPRALFAGVYTGCCQHPGGVGSVCAWHAHESPDGAVWAIERNGRIVAQAWVWRRDRALVLDSVEATASAGAETLRTAKQMFSTAAENTLGGALGIERVYVGTSYGGVHWRKLPARPRPFDAPVSYTDSHDVWLIAGEEQA